MKIALSFIFIILTTQLFAKSEANKLIVNDLVARSFDLQKLALKEMEHQFKALQSDVLLAEENDKLTTSLLSEVEKYFARSLKDQKKALNGYGLTELQNLQDYLKRQQEKSIAIAQITDLEDKVRDFFKSGSSQKVPDSKLTLINDYYLLTKQDELMRAREKASEPFIKKSLNQAQQLDKTQLHELVQAVHRKTAQSGQLHFLYTHSLQSEDDLKRDIEFFKTNGYKRYLESQTRNSKRQTQILMKHMTKLMGRIEKETKSKKL